MIKDINVRPESLKLSERTIEITLEDTGIGNVY
jgi:hypothetical protein